MLDPSPSSSSLRLLHCAIASSCPRHCICRCRAPPCWIRHPGALLAGSTRLEQHLHLLPPDLDALRRGCLSHPARATAAQAPIASCVAHLSHRHAWVRPTCHRHCRKWAGHCATEGVREGGKEGGREKCGRLWERGREQAK